MDELFDLIRKEEVIIWAGAGFSGYAGYKNGKDLCKILYDELTDDQRKDIDSWTSLPDLAEEIYRIKDHNNGYLIEALIRNYIDQEPITKIYHEKLASIPHFKTIITTNYDRLFEESYGEKGQLVFKSEQIPSLKKDLVGIFKAHGDLSEPNTIILKRTDYNNFFKNDNQHDIFWNVIKERLATKSVLFLGYALEDPNTSIIFDKITEVLKEHKRKCFLVAPNFKRHKIKDLKSKGITYIDSTAEKIIDQLIINLEENIIDDFNCKSVSPQVFNGFLKKYGVKTILKSGKDSYELKSIEPTEQNARTQLNFSFKPDSKLDKKFDELIEGKNFDGIEIAKEDLEKMKYSINGIKLISEKDIGKLVIKKNPNRVKIDLRFSDGTEFSDILIEMFASEYLVEITCYYKMGVLKIRYDKTLHPSNVTEFTFTRNEICEEINDEILLYSLLMKFFSGMDFTIFRESENLYTGSCNNGGEFSKTFTFYNNYFNNLKKIEQNFNFKFNKFDFYSITIETDKSVRIVISAINGSKTDINFTEQFEAEIIFEDAIANLNKLENLKPPIEIIYLDFENIEIHNRNIGKINKKIEVIEYYICNRDRVLANRDNIVHVKSIPGAKSNLMYMFSD